MPNILSGMFGKKLPNIKIERNCYTMAIVDGDTAEITMYGEIVEQQPTDWWGEPIEGEFITQSEFLEDLKAIEDAKTIIIRMNSIGGDAGVAILIHNRLRELAAKGKKLICIVDGMAMSGGSLIMCACDTVRVNPSSIIMIHKCIRLLFGWYNADELRQIADSNDAWDKAQVSIYKRKTNLSETVIKHMMAETTYMTGKEAVDKGFADELLDDAEPVSIAASADRSTIYVNGRAIRLMSPLPSKLPEYIQTVNPGANAPVKTNNNMPAETGSEEGGNVTMAKTIEELRAEYPELVKQIEAEAKAAASADQKAAEQKAVNDAVQAERKRLQEIDEIASAINDPDLVKEAKYGEKACSAQELAFRAMQKQAKQGEQHLEDVKKDYQASNASSVSAAPNGGEDDPKKSVEAVVDAGIEAVKKARTGGR